MARLYRQSDRRQCFRLPEDMSDWVPKTNMAHLPPNAIMLMDLPVYAAARRPRATPNERHFRYPAPDAERGFRDTAGLDRAG
jgi:hypothetical protein